MEQNQSYVRRSTALHDGAAALARRCAEMARVMIASSLGENALTRGGRKAHRLDTAVPAASTAAAATAGGERPS
jgi:hypothetical protein